MHHEIIRIFSAPSALSAVKKLFYDFLFFDQRQKYVAGEIIVSKSLAKRTDRVSAFLAMEAESPMPQLGKFPPPDLLVCGSHAPS